MGEITRGEQNVIDDANEFVRQSANLQSEIPETSGIRPHPLVESTEQTLDTTRFGFGFGPKPLADVTPESGGPPSGTTGACCVGSDCTIQTESDCTGMSGTYQGDDTVCDPNPCCTAFCYLVQSNSYCETGACDNGGCCPDVRGTHPLVENFFCVNPGGGITQHHLCDDSGYTCCSGCDTATVDFDTLCGASVLWDISRDNGDGPAGHYMLRVLIQCLGHVQTDWIDLGTSPIGVHAFSFLGDGTESGGTVVGFRYTATIEIRAAGDCPDTGACCQNDGSCSDGESVESCTGDYRGAGTLCESEICGNGACCHSAGCTVTSEANCTDDLFGTFQGLGTVCEDYTGACCSFGDCFEGYCEETCVDSLGGTFQGIGTTCDPYPC